MHDYIRIEGPQTISVFRALGPHEGDDDNDVGEMKVSIIMHGPPPHPLSPSYVNESNKCDVQVHYTTIGERGWGGDLHEGIYGVSIVGWV